MKNTLNQNTMNNTEIKRNYATAIKGEAVLGVRIELSSADMIAMQQVIYAPLERKLRAEQLLKQSGLDGWNIPEGMTKEEWKEAQEKYAKDSGYDSWYDLREESRWNFGNIQGELEVFFSKIKVENVETMVSTLFDPFVIE